MARAAARPARSESGGLWTPEELEVLLQTSMPPTTPDQVFLKPDAISINTGTSTTTASSSGSPSLQSEDVRSETDPLAVVSNPDEMGVELDAAAKRIRRTEIERLSRRRRQESLRGMRDEVRALETKFAGLMQGHAVRKRVSTASTPAKSLDCDITMLLDDPDGDDDASSSELKFSDQMQRLRERFIELKLRESELEEQQKELQRSLRGKQLVAISIQSVAFSALRTWSDPETAPLPEGGELAFQYHPADEYARLMRGAYDELQAVEAATTFDPLSSHCLGWSTRCSVNEARVVFSLTKSFEGRDAEPILLESWNVFSSEARLRQSFGSQGIDVQLRVIDRPSDDIVVIHRSNIRKGCKSKGEHRGHVVFLLFRVRTADGVTLCMRSVPSLQTELEPPDHWTGIFTWIHFRDLTRSDGTKSCEIIYNNYMPMLRRRPLSDLFVAFLSTAVRWESACVASHLLTAEA